MVDKVSVSRRRFLSAGAVASTSALLPTAPAEARTYRAEVPWQSGKADFPEGPSPGGYIFFTAAEAAFMEAAVDRLIPADELGPGAKLAGVAIFIDRQMDGPYGSGQHWYMQGPWAEGEATQGYQTRMSPAQVYRAAITAIDDYCRKTFNNQPFASLKEAQQDELLRGLESGDIKLANVKATTFFDLLLQNTIEGFFSDPLYGGNRDMIGWKLIGFPGAHYDYREYVSKHNEPVAIAPVGIRGRPGWTHSD